MMKYLQKLGRSLMLPVAVLPVASILMGIGYWIDPAGWGGGSPIAAFLISAGGAIKESISKIFLFTSGVVEIIEDVFDIDFDDDKISLARLNSHLKFLAKRIIQKKPDTKDNVEDFYDMFMKKDKRFKNVIKKIKPFVKKSFDYELSRQECVYLMVHINKVVS